MPYCKGPYAEFTSLPSPSTTVLHSSRNIDFVNRRYTTDSDGNPEAMPSTRQRVALAVDFGAGEIPKFQTDRELARRKAAIIKALSSLVSEGAIKLDINKITVVAQGAGGVKESIPYTDLHTGIDDVVERWR